MPPMPTRRSKIIGVGSAVPPRTVANQDMVEWMDTSDEWIQQRSGIENRHWAPRDTSMATSDLALQASRAALDSAGLEPTAIDMIVFATLSPDRSFPGSGCYLQAKLGLPGIPALDIRQQCSGFLYGLSIADLYIRAGEHETVLLVGAEMQSKCLELATRGRDMTVLFGDGAGAVLLTKTEVRDTSAKSKESFVLSSHLHADGRFADELLWASPGTANHIWNPPELVEATDAYPQMNGRLVFTHAVKRMPEVTLEALEANGLSVSDVDLFINHQANQRINDKVASALGVPAERVVNTIDRYSNTTAATIPIGLDVAVKDGRLTPGMLVCSAAFGSGFTWAASLYRW